MSSIMDALGVGPEITFEGKVYRLKPMTLIHAAMFSAWLERQAWEGVQRAEAWLSPKAYEKAMKIVADNVASGEYDFGSALYANAAVSQNGLKYLTLLSLKENHPDVDEAFVDRFFEKAMAEITTREKAKREAKERKDKGES